MAMLALSRCVVTFRISLLFPFVIALLLSMPSIGQAAGYSTHPSMLDTAQRYKDGDQLESLWDLWHNWTDPDNRSTAARNKQREMFKSNGFSDELRANSHNYYILEAKMGISQASQGFNERYLSENNAGLSAFRAGVKPFFMEKDYPKARREFANSIFFSAKLDDQDRQQLYKLTGYAPLKPLLNNEVEFSHSLSDYFIEAGASEKNAILDHIEAKNLSEKDLLNLYWALGAFIVTNNQYGTEFSESQLYADSQKSLYLKLKNKFEFATATNSIWFPWH